MYRIQVKDHFDAAHYLRDYSGKCKNMHGHRWDVEICLESKSLNKLNMVIDFTIVKRIFHEIFEDMDHKVLNDTLGEPNLTAEFLSKLLYMRFQGHLNLLEDCNNVRVARVTVWESPECCVKYSPDMHATGEKV